MIVKGTTRVCGLIGDPVAHTKSPLIQNMLADLCGIDLVYVPFHVTARSEEEMRALVQGAFALDILGLNATIPFKQLVIPHLVSIDPVAERIGAVNTLVRAENGYKGYNTDIAGLERDLASHGISPEGRNILIIGRGILVRFVRPRITCDREQDAAEGTGAHRGSGGMPSGTCRPGDRPA